MPTQSIRLIQTLNGQPAQGSFRVIGFYLHFFSMVCLKANTNNTYMYGGMDHKSLVPIVLNAFNNIQRMW